MKTFEIAIDINAPQSQVWDVFFDLKNYGNWNPTIPMGLGKLAVNETLELTWQRPKRQVIFHPKILAIEAEQKMIPNSFVTLLTRDICKIICLPTAECPFSLRTHAKKRFRTVS